MTYNAYNIGPNHWIVAAWNERAGQWQSVDLRRDFRRKNGLGPRGFAFAPKPAALEGVRRHWTLKSAEWTATALNEGTYEPA